MAGALAQGKAAILSGLVIQQWKSEGAPFIF
jgi:trimethylamine:corrinoid methyltransferase-like protein